MHRVVEVRDSTGICRYSLESQFLGTTPPIKVASVAESFELGKASGLETAKNSKAHGTHRKIAPHVTPSFR